MQLARARRRVLVMGTGVRRNRFAETSHGFLGPDGRSPGAISAEGRAGVLSAGKPSLHRAMMLPDWGTATLFTNEAFVPDASQIAQPPMQCYGIRSTLGGRRNASDSYCARRGSGPRIRTVAQQN
jgi:hypothetical protein